MKEFYTLYNAESLVDTAHVVYTLLKIEVVDTRNLEKIKSRRIIIRWDFIFSKGDKVDTAYIFKRPIFSKEICTLASVTVVH